jgi:hypothetical protein
MVLGLYLTAFSTFQPVGWDLKTGVIFTTGLSEVPVLTLRSQVSLSWSRNLITSGGADKNLWSGAIGASKNQLSRTSSLDSADIPTYFSTSTPLVAQDPRVLAQAEQAGLDPFRPYNSIRSVSYLRLNETNKTV